MYLVKFSKQAEKDKQRLKAAGLEKRARDLLDILLQDPFQNPPPNEKLGLHPKIRTVNKNPSCCRIRATTGGIRYAKTIYKN